MRFIRVEMTDTGRNAPGRGQVGLVCDHSGACDGGAGRVDLAAALVSSGGRWVQAPDAVFEAARRWVAAHQAAMLVSARGATPVGSGAGPDSPGVDAALCLAAAEAVGREIDAAFRTLDTSLMKLGVAVQALGADWGPDWRAASADPSGAVLFAAAP